MEIILHALTDVKLEGTLAIVQTGVRKGHLNFLAEMTIAIQIQASRNSAGCPSKQPKI